MASGGDDSRERRGRQKIGILLKELGFKDTPQSRKLDPWMIAVLARDQDQPQQQQTLDNNNNNNNNNNNKTKRDNNNVPVVKNELSANIHNSNMNKHSSVSEVNDGQPSLSEKKRQLLCVNGLDEKNSQRLSGNGNTN